MATRPIRVPVQVHEEVAVAARLLDKTPGQLLEEAWTRYRETPNFRDDFTFAQKAFGAGDLEAIAQRLQERSYQRASERAETVRRLRRS